MFVHQGQLIYTSGILVANNGPHCAGDKVAFIKWLFSLGHVQLQREKSVMCIDRVCVHLYMCTSVEKYKEESTAVMSVLLLLYTIFLIYHIITDYTSHTRVIEILTTDVKGNLLNFVLRTVQFATLNL